MCCRYFIEETTEMQAIVSDMLRSSLVQKWNALAPIKTCGEISPTDIVPVIASNRSRQRAVFPMKWGYSAGRSAGGPSGGNGRGSRSLLINARAETAAEKRTFREDWK